MELLVTGMAIGCAIGVAVSLLAWIPPIRSMGQRSARARKGIIFGLGSVAGILFWLLVAYMMAHISLILNPAGVGDDFFNNRPSIIYDEEVLQHWDVIRRELWLRLALPLPLRGPCFTGQATACRWADQLVAGWKGDWGTWRVYLLVLLLSFGLPALLSGTLAGYATRQKRVDISEQNPP